MLDKVILDRVIEVVEEFDWIQGKYWERDEDGNITACCLKGAMLLAFRADGQSYNRCYYLLTEKLQEMDSEIAGPVNFNDHIAQSKEEVLEMLRRINQ